MNEYKPSPEFEEKVRKAVSAPSANPEFVNQLRNELVRRPVKMKSGFKLKPVWVFVIVIIALALIAAAPSAVNALKKLFGYVPGVGLVENMGNLRILAEPSSVTRDGITVTVMHVMAYEDHVELTYQVNGVVESYDTGSDMCGSNHPNNDFWSDRDAELRLPDGTVVSRDYAGKYQSQNTFAMKPVYAVSVPSDVTEMTMLLKCIPFTKLGSVPENWEVPFKLVAVPAGTVVGAPVIEVDVTSVQPTMKPQPSPETPNVPATATSNVPAPVVKMTLEKIVPLESRTVFYFSMDMENRDPSLISIMPVNAYVIDSLGQKLPLIGNFAWMPFEHRVGSAFEFMSQSKPAPGPLTLTVENAVMVYAPLYTDPPQTTPDQMSFTFNVGENPQLNQTWSLDNEFTIVGYKLKVTSARATNYDDVKSRFPDFNYISQGYEYGYDFAVQADPSVKMKVWIDIMSIMSESPTCGLTNVVPDVPESSSIHYIRLCRDEYPKGDVRVTIGELSVLMENVWQATWASQ